MSSLTLRNIAPELMERLKAQALLEKRSLNNQILVLLEREAEAPYASREGTRARYDFTSLAGKLQWSGDARKAQRELRNEW
jgi:hypothetical protein